MGGREAVAKRYVIGRHGSPWTPTTAREEAQRLLTMAKQGKDPFDVDRERKRVAVDLAFEPYAERFLEVYGRANWNEGTHKDSCSYVRRYLVPALKRKALPDIKRSDIAALFDDMPKGKVALSRNVYAVTRRLFAWAVERGDLTVSPLLGHRAPPVAKSRDRYLTDKEVKLVWEGTGEGGPMFGPMFRLLLITAQRREEVAGLDWRELDRGAAEWTLPAHRAKNGMASTVPLSPLAIAELDRRAGGTEWPRKGLVFTTTGKTPASGISKAKTRLDGFMVGRAGEEIEAWRLHDLRRTAATGLQRLGVRFEVTEAVLNHVSGSRSGVAGVYQRHNWREEKREALDAWAAHLASVTE
jgi:integrase